MKIVFLTRFGQQGVSSGMSLLQYLPWCASAVIRSVVSPLFDDAILLRKYQHGGYGLLELPSAYGRRIDHLMEGVRLVITGSRYFADRATAAGVRRVEAEYCLQQTAPRLVCLRTEAGVQ